MWESAQELIHQVPFFEYCRGSNRPMNADSARGRIQCIDGYRNGERGPFSAMMMPPQTRCPLRHNDDVVHAMEILGRDNTPSQVINLFTRL